MMPKNGAPAGARHVALMDEDENQDSTHERRNRRSLVLLMAKVSTPDGVLDVRLRNLSQKGALLEGDRIPPVGTDLIFERGETKVRGRVAWARDGRFGIEFLIPIEEREVLIHIGRPSAARPMTGTSFKRSGFHASSLSAGEQGLAADWVRSTGRPTGD